MQFLLVAYDGTDSGAMERRMKVREEHLEKIADKNLNRLLPLTEKKCIFSFMTWKSYLIVIY